MKITNKTVGWAIPITFVLLTSSLLIIETTNHGCKFFGVDCVYGQLRVLYIIILITSLLVSLMFLTINLLSGFTYFEYEIKLPRSQRRTLNRLYSKMGEAAMKGDEAEEKRIWETIQRMENR